MVSQILQTASGHIFVNATAKWDVAAVVVASLANRTSSKCLVFTFFYIKSIPGMPSMPPTFVQNLSKSTP